MGYQAVFKRYELKYLLTEAQKQAVLQAMQPHMAPDKYGRTTIRNIYFDTPNYRLIRRSLEKPVYKGKLRIRSYQKADADSTVFVELKKKYDSVVYKRRISLPAARAMNWLCHREGPEQAGQIIREIDYFLDFYSPLSPTVFLCYDRVAYYAKDCSDFRVTFDDNILCRRENLYLDSDPSGAAILPPGMTLMEIKSNGGIPLWLSHTLTQNRIFKTSFSKYGIAYQTLIFPNQHREVLTNGNTV